MLGKVLMYLFMALSMATCVVFCCFRAKKATILTLALKTLSSVFFVLSGLMAIYALGASHISLLLIIAGLVLGLIGDIILDLKIMYPQQSDGYFVTGTMSFALGHICYFFSVMEINRGLMPDKLGWNLLIALAVAIIATGAILLLSKPLKLNFGKNLWAVIVYSLLLTFMVGFSITLACYFPIFWVLASGMILFFLSDLVLSTQYFGGKDQKWLIFLNHILYYSAQCLIAISIFVCFA